MRLAITGAEGILGTELIKQDKNIVPITRKDFDLTDYEAMNKWFIDNNERFDVLAHIAGMTDLNMCEQFPDRCMETNSEGTKNLVYLCNYYNKSLVFISTAQVFDGWSFKSMQTDDVPKVIENVYAKSKLYAERHVLKNWRNKVIRTSWLYSNDPRDNKFVAKIANKILDGETDFKIIKTWGKVTYKPDLAKFIINICNQAYSESYSDFGQKIYHFTDRGLTNRIELVQFIAYELEADVNITQIYEHDSYKYKVGNEILASQSLNDWQSNIRLFLKRLIEQRLEKENVEKVEAEPVVGNFSTYLNF